MALPVLPARTPAGRPASRAPRRSVPRRIGAVAGASVLVLALAAGTAASAAPAAPDHVPDDVAAAMTLVPQTELLPVTPTSYPMGAAARNQTPLDLAAIGYVEEEYLVRGEANAYTDTGDAVATTMAAVPYTNRVVVRRPADAADATGVVFFELLNSSSGYDTFSAWERAWEEVLERGDTYVGMTSKPMSVEALRTFDPERYGDLSWYLPDAEPRDPITMDTPGYDPFAVLDDAEEGFVWDITTQLSNLLHQDGNRLTGGPGAQTVVLAGVSQASVSVTTYADQISATAEAVLGRVPFEGYLPIVGAPNNRPLTQQGNSWLPVHVSEEPAINAPLVAVSAEGDARLWPGAFAANPDQADGREHWQVAATSHSAIFSPRLQTAEDILRAGRPASPPPEDLTNVSLVPIEPAVGGAYAAVVAAAQDGAALPASRYLDQSAPGEFVRDANGIVTGGLRYGLVEYPLGTLTGSASGAFYGYMDLLDAEEFADRYGTRSDYLTLVAAHDANLAADGYLTELGVRTLRDVADEMLDRIGVPDDGSIPVTGEIPGTDAGPGALVLSVADGGVTLGAAQDQGDRWSLAGTLPEVSVTDTRTDATGWSATGQGAELRSGEHAVGADRLGWVPRLASEPRPGVSAGPLRAGSMSGGNGLAVPATLGTASVQGRLGTTELTADVELEVPRDTPGGTYAGTLTVSVFPTD